MPRLCSDEVAIVTGIPRSGTSLMMAMLGAAGLDLLVDDHRAPDPSNPRGYFELEAVKHSARDTSWIAQAGGRAVKVIHHLVRHLPRDRRYRVVLMKRDLSEIVASQNEMLLRLGRPAGELSEARLATIFAAQLEETESLLASQACFATLTVEYAQLIADPVPEALRVARHFGVEDHARLMAEIVDPRLHRIRHTRRG